MDTDYIARILMSGGAVLFLLGAFLSNPKGVPLGRLLGDIQIRLGSTDLSIPITTIILVSIVLTLMINFLSR